MSPYKHCVLCPRRCGVDREAGELGFCGETAVLRLAFAGIHSGEEPPVTGQGGSGTIFVSGCNLGCVFCQNFQISQGERIAGEVSFTKGKHPSRAIGRAVSTEEFASICLALQERGAENINIVTGSHAAPALASGIEAARKQGLSIPVLWNSSGYDGAESLEILKDFVDVYLPDLKTLDREFAARFFNAPDYPEHAAKAILKMMEYRKLAFAPGRLGAGETMSSGVMIRHLVIPGFLESTRRVLRWFAENCGGQGGGLNHGANHALLSLMTQYTPLGDNAPDRYVSGREHEAVLSMLDEFGIDDGFCQELIPGSDWLPDFKQRNPFSSALSVPVWHWQDSDFGAGTSNASGSVKEV